MGVAMLVLMFAVAEATVRFAPLESRTCDTDSDCEQMAQYVEWHHSGMVRP